MNRSFSSSLTAGVVLRRGVLLTVPAWFFLTEAPGQAAKGEWVSQGRGAVWKPAETSASASGSTGQRVSKSKSKGKGKTGSRKKPGRSSGYQNSPAPSQGTGSLSNTGAAGAVVLLPGGSGGGTTFTGGGTDVIVGGSLGSGGLISVGGTGSTTLGGSGGVANVGGGLQSGTTVLNLNPASTETLYSELGGTVVYHTGLNYGTNLIDPTTRVSSIIWLSGNSVVYPGSISDNGTRGTALTKTGSGTMVLTGTNAYSGTTNVSAGVLVINGNNSAATGAVTINTGATLAGMGSIGGMVTNSGTLAPGTSASPGTLTLSAGVTLAESSSLSFDLLGTDQTVGGGVNDLLTGTTHLTLDGTLNVNDLAAGSFLSADLGDSWRLLNYSGTLTDRGLSRGNLPALPAVLSFAVETAVPGQVNLVVVPEPGAAGLLALAGGLLARWRRRRTE